MTTPLRRLIKRILPWTVPLYEKCQAIISGMMPLKEFQTIYGYKLVGPDCSFLEQQSNGTYERSELDWMAGKFQGGGVDLFVDAGANVGLYTMLALRHGIPAIAIEPQSKNVRAIRKGLRVNGFDCLVCPVALSDADGTATMFGLSTGSASLVKNWHVETSWIRRKVRTARLDTILSDGLIAGKRLLIKLDLEGNEWKALLGAQKTLARVPKPIWMVEVVDFAFPGGVHPHKADIFALFDRHGYVAREISTGNWMLEEG